MRARKTSNRTSPSGIGAMPPALCPGRRALDLNGIAARAKGPVLAGALALMLVACAPPGEGREGLSNALTEAPPATKGSAPTAATAASPAPGGWEEPVAVAERLVAAQAAAGIDFKHVHGGSGARYMVETMTGGAGWLDADGDGLLDAYLIQSGPLPGYPDQTPLPNQLFRNRGDGSFEDVTEGSGLGDTGYGMGACYADVDNDGDVDVHVTNFGADRLYSNDGSGVFEDVTEEAGINNPAWSASCAFADYDRDGWLDLYVTNYVDYRLDSPIVCEAEDRPHYCHPDNFGGVSDILYRNTGDGVFEDVTVAAGVQITNPAQGKGLGAAWLDADDDGDVDLYVANDSTRNFLYQNEGDGTFRDIGIRSGSAFNRNGETEAGMGIAVGDTAGIGRLDLFVTHLDFETNTLYRNLGKAGFDDASEPSGLAGPSITRVGFGAQLFDLDLDGDLDLFVANGHLLDNVAELSDTLTFAQPNQLFENRGDGVFRDISDASGAHFATSGVSRAVAAADYDDDGDLDLLVAQCDEPAVLLRNYTERAGRWIMLDLRSKYGGRSAVGARATVIAHASGMGAGGKRATGAPDPANASRTWIAELRAGDSYLAQGDPRLHFGLGDVTRLERVIVRWPEGDITEIDGAELTLDAVHVIRQEEG